MSHLAPWCSGNILAFGANVGGSNPPGAVLIDKRYFSECYGYTTCILSLKEQGYRLFFLPIR